MANTNPHPLSKFRANGPLSNMAEFAKAFGCKKGEPMVREQTCKNLVVALSRNYPIWKNLEGARELQPTRVLEVENDPAASWKLFCPCLKKAVAHVVAFQPEREARVPAIIRAAASLNGVGVFGLSGDLRLFVSAAKNSGSQGSHFFCRQAIFGPAP